MVFRKGKLPLGFHFCKKRINQSSFRSRQSSVLVTVNGSMLSLNQNYMGMLVECSFACCKRTGNVNQTACQDAVRLIITNEVGTT